MIWADAWKKVRCGSTSPRILGYPPDVVRFPASGVKADQGLTNSTSALATPVLGQRKSHDFRGFLRADDGTRTHDLLHGKQTL